MMRMNIVMMILSIQKLKETDPIYWWKLFLIKLSKQLNTNCIMNTLLKFNVSQCICIMPLPLLYWFKLCNLPNIHTTLHTYDVQWYTWKSKSTINTILKEWIRQNEYNFQEYIYSCVHKIHHPVTMQHLPNTGFFLAFVQRFRKDCCMLDIDATIATLSRLVAQPDTGQSSRSGRKRGGEWWSTWCFLPNTHPLLYLTPPPP